MDNFSYTEGGDLPKWNFTMIYIEIDNNGDSIYRDSVLLQTCCVSCLTKKKGVEVIFQQSSQDCVSSILWYIFSDKYISTWS